MKLFRSCRGVCFASWLALFALSCASPTSPTLPVAPRPSAPAGFAGDWAGTNSHGAAVNFKVSDDHVTSFTLSFNLPPTCSGSETLIGPVQIALRPDNQ